MREICSCRCAYFAVVYAVGVNNTKIACDLSALICIARERERERDKDPFAFDAALNGGFITARGNYIRARLI